MQSLFPQYGSVFGGGNNAGRNELVAFNAGKMTVKPTANGKFLISPELKKGKICLTRGDDQLLHFQWVDRQTGASADDFIIFPDDASFGKVNTGRDGDRVYILQYKNSSRRFFFWMQHKDDSRDEELAKKVNDFMNNAQPAGGSDGGRGGPGNVQLDHNAIMQMLGAMGAGGEQGRGGSAGGGAAGGVQMADLQNILQNMGLPASQAAAASGVASGASSQTSQSGGASSAAATTASTHEHDHDHDAAMDMDDMTEEELLRLAIEESMRDAQPDGDSSSAPTTVAAPQLVAAPAVSPAPQPPAPPANPPATGGITAEDLQRAMASIQAFSQPKPISLTKLLSAANVESLLNDEASANALLPHLPEGAQSVHELRGTLRSPQLRQSIASLASALQSGNFNAVLTNFGLDPAAGAAKLAFGDGIGAFLDAIQHWANQQDSSMQDEDPSPATQQ